MAGARAVYADVRRGVDLVVDVTRLGVRYYLLVRTEPTGPAEAEALRQDLAALEVQVVAEGATARTSEDGVDFVIADEVVASVGQATAWDAAADSALEHPVGEPYVPSDGEVPVAGVPGVFAGVGERGPDPVVAPDGTGAEAATATPDGGEVAAIPPGETEEIIEIPSIVGEVSGDSVTVSVAPAADYLLDPDTTYPVVVDPPVDISTPLRLDTFVQNTISNSDQSGGPELKIGTYDGSTVTRSFLHWDVSAYSGRRIVSAGLELFNTYSYQCAAAGWEMWNSDVPTTSSRWTSQPYSYQKWAETSATRGYNSSCPGAWVQLDVTNLLASWAAAGFGNVGMGLRASSESSTAGWKKFASAEGGAPPTLWVDYNVAPPAASDFRISESGEVPHQGSLWTRATAPNLSVAVSDPDGNNVNIGGYLIDTTTGATVGSKRIEGVAPGWRATWTLAELGASSLVANRSYRFATIVDDGRDSSPWQDFYFAYDPWAPYAPSVSSPEYPSDGQWHQDQGVAGQFFMDTASVDVTHFLWNVDGPPDPARRLTAVPGSGGNLGQGMLYAPLSKGRHTLQVVAVDRAGHQSMVVKYVFIVGRAGILLPEEGARVVSQARVAVGVGDPSLTHVNFVYRRGTGAPAAVVPTGQVHRPDGTPFPSTGQWLPLTDLAVTCPTSGGWSQEQADFCSATGGFAVWDAARTLGRAGGPVQIQALFATSNNPGQNFYAGQWVTVVVDTDVDGAATAPVGPGSVNLLTGDYSVGVTDVEEFGLSIGRTTSSRDTDSGYVQQRQLLSDNQRMVNTDTAGFGPGNTTLSRVTDKGRTTAVVNGAVVSDALRIGPTGATTDSYAHLGGDGGDRRFGMQEKRRYRLTGSVFVDGSSVDTGRNAERAYRMVAFFRVGTAAYTSQVSAAPAPEQLREWVDLSLDLTVPTGATEAFVRLYNGSGNATSVYWDDLSLREVWAPLGPEWQLATSVDAVGTAYDRLSFPESGVAAVEVAGGGKIWFTASGNDTGRWWPMPGAEDLTLVKHDATTWRLTEIDGTITDFRQRAGQSDWLVDTTSPPTQEGQARYVYRAIDTLTEPWRIIAPLEPGVDPAGCLAATPAAGCEVLQFDYANDGTITPTSPGHLGAIRKVKAVRAFNGALLGAGGTEVARFEYVDGHLARVWDPRVGGTATGSAYAYDTGGAYSVGHLTTITPPGELPWRFEYMTEGTQVTGGGDVLSGGAGRLRKVRRQSLQARFPGEAGYDAVDPAYNETSLVYGVPLTRSGGGPHDLDGATIASWAQVEAPTDATAIFGPQAPVPPASGWASATVPGPAGYRQVEVHYLNASGATLNTSSPLGGLAGLDASTRAAVEQHGYVDTVDYDVFGNVIRSLDATNRLLALGVGATATADLNALGLGGLGTGSRALALSSVNAYSVDGLDLLRTVGPVRRLAVGNNPDATQVLRTATITAYDEGKPDGQTYHLPTTVTTGAVTTAWAAADPFKAATLLDATRSTMGYSPVDGGDPIGRTSGWFHRQPTAVRANVAIPGRAANGPSVESRVVYDTRGRPIESRAQAPGMAAGTPQTTTTVLYTAAGDATDPACRNKPEWAGQPCVTRQGGTLNLPEKRVTDYTDWGDPRSVTESAGTGAGAQTRTTATAYDGAGRVTQVSIAGTGPGMTGATAVLSATTTSYDATTGDALSQSATVGGTVRTVSRQVDQLGRLTSYDDGAGGVTRTRFDRLGRPQRNVESINGQSVWREFDYEPERGYLVGVRDAVAGTLTATYGPDGQVVSQGLPGGVSLGVGYDAARVPVSRTYRASGGQDIASSSVVENSAGLVVRSASSAAVQVYAYDGLGRLTGAGARSAGAGVCSWREYGFADSPGTSSGLRGQRSSVAEFAASGGSCPVGVTAVRAAGATVVGGTDYSYDAADRLTSTSVTDATSSPVVSNRSLAGSWVVDALGRTSRAPVGSLGRAAQGQGTAGVVATSFFVNDVVSQMTVADASRMTWELDPLQRVSRVKRDAWSGGVWVGAADTVSHYDADGDEPSWVHEETSDPFAVSRYVEDPTGAWAVTTGSTTSGAATLSMLDVQGSVMGTVPLIAPSGGSGNTATETTVPSWSVDVPGLRLKASSEFGAPLDLTSARSMVSPGTAGDQRVARYGWHGGAQRSTDALAGVVLMGVRVFDPALGRFFQRDPVPGGNATTYDYCSGDPVNCTDFDGQWSLSGVLKGVAVIAEVAAFIPGPVGAAAGAISAGAYLATGNKRKAAEMAVVAAANLVGAGAAVKVGLAAVRTTVKVGRVGGAAARSATRTSRVSQAAGRSCKANSFAAGTPVLLADGSMIPIEDVQPGDYVAATDPTTGITTAQPVLDTITRTGQRHLLTLTLRHLTSGDTTQLTVTAGHPLWVLDTALAADPVTTNDLSRAVDIVAPAWSIPPTNGPPSSTPATLLLSGPNALSGGWSTVSDIRVGNHLAATTSPGVLVTGVIDQGWFTTSVHNLHIGGTHTYHAGQLRVLSHNAKSCEVYRLDFSDGSAYVGHTNNLFRRLGEHVRRGVIAAAGRAPIRTTSVAHNLPRASARVREQQEMDRLRSNGVFIRNKIRAVRR